jgi:glycosyltransferase involved in cell wall biosynthesis
VGTELAIVEPAARPWPMSNAEERRPGTSSGRRRILLVIGQLGWGGSERQMTELATRLCRTDEVEVVCTSSAIDPYGPRLEQAGIRVHRPAGDGRLAKLGRLVWLVTTLRRVRCDVVVFFSIRNLVALAATTVLRVPRISTERSYGIWKSRAYVLMDRLLYRRCCLVVCNSEAARAHVVGGAPEVAPRTRVVYNGIELEPLVPSDIADAEVVRFCLVAGLRPWKNHRLLVEAAVRLEARGVPFEVVLVGDGPCRETVEHQIREHGLQDRFVLMGWQQDPLPVIRSCHVNLNVSTFESLSNAVIEGMMTGRASIVTDVGGNPELIRDRVRGLVVPSGDPEALAQAMESLATDPGTAVRLGLEARHWVEEHLAMDRMVEGMSRCIDEALGRLVP